MDDNGKEDGALAGILAATTVLIIWVCLIIYFMLQIGGGTK